MNWIKVSDMDRILDLSLKLKYKFQEINRKHPETKKEIKKENVTQRPSGLNKPLELYWCRRCLQKTGKLTYTSPPDGYFCDKLQRKCRNMSNTAEIIKSNPDEVYKYITEFDRYYWVINENRAVIYGERTEASVPD